MRILSFVMITLLAALPLRAGVVFNPFTGKLELTSAGGGGTTAVTGGGTGLTSGTSGGVPCYTASTTMASSGALTANLPVIGGGAGVCPSVGTRSGNTTAYVTTTGSQTSGDCVKIDASGNHIANGSACGGAAKLNFGFDFRATSGYVTDPGYAVFVTDTTTDATMAYPHTFTNGGGVAVVAGWDAGASSVVSRDRTTTYVTWGAGSVILDSGTATFRIDLPATGKYEVYTTWGDPGNGVTTNGLITDNGTTRVTITGTTTGGATGTFLDSNSIAMAAGSWWTNLPITVNFTSTVMRVVLNPGANTSRLMNLRIVQD